MLFACPLNLQYLFNFYEMIRYGNQKDCRKIFFKVFLLVCSLGGIVLFALLGRIEHCKCINSTGPSHIAVVMSMEECFQLTSEEQCFFYQDRFNTGCSVVCER